MIAYSLIAFRFDRQPMLKQHTIWHRVKGLRFKWHEPITADSGSWAAIMARERVRACAPEDFGIDDDGRGFYIDLFVAGPGFHQVSYQFIKSKVSSTVRNPEPIEKPKQMTPDVAAIVEELKRHGIVLESSRYTIRRTYAGRHQRDMGGWSWWLCDGAPRDERTYTPAIGSQYPVRKCAMAARKGNLDIAYCQVTGDIDLYPQGLPGDWDAASSAHSSSDTSDLSERIGM